MKRPLRYLISALVILTVISGCILLPLTVFQFQDRKIMDRVRTEDLEELSAVRHTLSVLEKIELLQGDFFGNVNTLPLSQGARLNQTTVWDAAKEEIAALTGHGLLPAGLSFVQNDASYAYSSFYINTEDPSQNMIAWNVFFTNGSQSLTLCLDDATGKGLQLFYFNIEDKRGKTDPDQTAEAWAEYLGAELLAQGEADGNMSVQSGSDPRSGSSAITDTPGSSTPTDSTDEAYYYPETIKAYCLIRLTDGQNTVVQPLIESIRGFSIGSYPDGRSGVF